MAFAHRKAENSGSPEIPSEGISARRTSRVPPLPWNVPILATFVSVGNKTRGYRRAHRGQFVAACLKLHSDSLRDDDQGRKYLSRFNPIRTAPSPEPSFIVRRISALTRIFHADAGFPLVLIESRVAAASHTELPAKYGAIDARFGSLHSRRDD